VNPTNQLCTGNPPVQLTAATTGGTWTGNGVDATGMFDPAAAGVGVHTITYTIADPCGDVGTLDITVGSLTATPSSTPAICTAANGTATLTPTSGVAPYSFEWNTTPIQTTETAVDLVAGDYDVTVLDADGCEIQQTITVGFDPSNLSVSIPTSNDVSCNGICDGVATALPAGGTAPYTYLWDDPTAQTTDEATALCAGTYNVGIADANGCLATDQVVIAEPTALSVVAVMDQESDCGQPNGEVSATASGGTAAVAYQYEWDSTPVQNTATATGLLPATYTVTATDDNGCEATTTVDVTTTAAITVSITSSTDAMCYQVCDGTATAQAGPNAVAPVTYSWNSTPTQNAATANGLCAGTYEVTITDNVGCTATESVTIGEPTQLNVQVTSSNAQICIGQSSDLAATISGGTTPYAAYAWSANPADPTLVTTSQNPTVSPVITTDYSLVVADANGCNSAPQDVTVEVSPPLSLNVTRPLFDPDTAICLNDFATLDLQAAGGDGNYSYYLLPDNTNQVQFPIQVNPTATTTYDFMVSDGCGTPNAFATSTITVNGLPTPNFTVDDPAGCEPHTVSFTDLSSPTPVSWNWNFGDASSNSNTSTSQNPGHQYQNDGLYSVSLSVTTAAGCSADTTFTDYVEVFALPVADFSADPERTTLLQGEIQFTDLSLGNIDQWEWQFGDGDTAMTQNPEHTYRDTGSYLVTLFVTTVEGCEDFDRFQVIIDPDVMFFVPNAFSPNDDGRNDSFRGYGTGVQWDTYEISIYNRWGEQIFYSNNIDAPWDGTFKGAQVPEEVYIYQILIYDQTGAQRTYRGRVTVFR
jgi:gliding motility-associated-like protein